jgi:hypothetical protein
MIVINCFRKHGYPLIVVKSIAWGLLAHGLPALNGGGWGLFMGFRLFTRS